jgi:tetratricopeptide (TPR) repeat protein
MATYELGILGLILAIFAMIISIFELNGSRKLQNKLNGLISKGIALEELGKYEEALECFEKALSLDPKHAIAWNNKGASLGILGKHEEALECFEKALSLDPKFAKAWNNKGMVLAIFDKMEEAIEANDTAIELNPKDGKAWNTKGLFLEKLGKTEPAFKAYEEAFKLGPKSATRYVTLARLYRKLGRESESFDACKLAHDLIENESEYNRACFEAVCGSPDSALALLRTALEKKQAPPDWARRDPDFEFIRDDPRFKALLDEFSTGGEKGPK